MSFIGYLSSPISMPPMFDTTPCLEHLMEYEDCVIDTGSDRLEYFMPTWPTLWPGLAEGKSNIKMDRRYVDPIVDESHPSEGKGDYTPLTERQKQLLYECEEERMVVKACMRKLIKLKRSPKHTSWDSAEAANMTFM